MQSKLDEIIKQIPAWKGVHDLQVEPLAGLNKTNYLMTVKGDRFVLRISGQEGMTYHTELYFYSRVFEFKTYERIESIHIDNL